MFSRPIIAVLAGMMLAGVAAGAPRPEPAGPASLAGMPIREITVFKDGHAFVLHEGNAPVDASGRVVLDYLPSPVLGTFWPYSADPKVKLTGVTAGRRRVSVSRTALSIPELVEGNVGAKVRIREVASPGLKDEPLAYEAVILGVPTRSAEELRRTSPPGTDERLPLKGSVVLLKTDLGVKAVQMARIQELTFQDGPQQAVAAEEFRNLLTLQLDGAARKDAAAVGMVYLQRGIRWIPNYRVEIDGKGGAQIKLQATLVNELADLDDVTANLVIGVPAFAFQETVDPMSLQQAVAQLSSHFGSAAGNRLSNRFSNAIMSQAVMAQPDGEPAAAGGARPMDLGPEVEGSRKSEDLYVFTVKHITLRKGERMIVPVAEYKLAYRDVYRLDLPFAPPAEARFRGGDTEQQQQLARLMAGPKVMHAIRLSNKSDQPLTTAPAVVLRDGRILAQGMMKYTSAGAEGDLDITTAVDIPVKKVDKESGRTPNAAKWHSNPMDRIDLVGQVHLTNHRDKAVVVEVTRHILGFMDGADHDGKIEQMSWSEGGWAGDVNYPPWWYWYDWPAYWHQFNGVGRATWKVTIEPGKSLDLEYKWHYLWG